MDGPVSGIFAAGIFFEGLFAVGIFAAWNFRCGEFSLREIFPAGHFHHMEFSPNGTFVARNFRRWEISPWDFGKIHLESIFSMFQMILSKKRNFFWYKQNFWTYKKKKKLGNFLFFFGSIMNANITLYHPQPQVLLT